MSNKFKAGDKVVVATLKDLDKDEATNWAIEGGLTMDEVYTVLEDDDGWVKIKGCKYWHSVERFELAKSETTTPTGLLPFNYEEARNDLRKVVSGIKGEIEFDNIVLDASGKYVIATKAPLSWIYNIDGTPISSDYPPLFLKQPETVVYVRVYKSGIGDGKYKSAEEIFRKKRNPSAKSIAALTILNGEIIKTETVHKY